MREMDRLLFIAFLVIVFLSGLMNIVLYTLLDNEATNFHNIDNMNIGVGVGKQLRDSAPREDNAKKYSNINGKEQIMKIISESGTELTPEVIDQLPTWSEVTSLYGSKPQIIGLDQCQHFQLNIPKEDAYIAPSGLFNTGTNLLSDTMQEYCTLPSRSQNKQNLTFQKGEPPPFRKTSGMLWQVPWGKHNPISWRTHHTAIIGATNVEQTHILPVAIIKDPFHWMGSMCRHSYSANWFHNPRHCPNLVPNEVDIGKRGITVSSKSVPVTLSIREDEKIHFDSLLHLWNKWYGDYLDVKEFPRLIIRFEDMLFHLEEIVTEICHCAGGTVINAENGIHLKSEAVKKGKSHTGSNGLLSAMSRYGSKHHRLDTMTKDDIQYANENAKSELMELFHYDYPEASVGSIGGVSGGGTVPVAK